MATSRAVIISLLVAVSAVGSGDAWSEAARRESGGDTARLQMMLQQLNTEKTNLSAANTKLKAELEKTQKELEAAVRERDAGTQKLGRSSQDLANTQARADSLQGGFDTLKGRFEQLVDQFRATVATMQELEQKRDRLAASVTDYEIRVAACERNNEALYKADLELIELYERKGVMTSLMQREPIAKLKRVEIENLMDDYRGLAEDMRLKNAEIDDVQVEGAGIPDLGAEQESSESDGV